MPLGTASVDISSLEQFNIDYLTNIIVGSNFHAAKYCIEDIADKESIELVDYVRRHKRLSFAKVKRLNEKLCKHNTISSQNV